MAVIARHYGMDWLRIAAFALLILYHIGMMFVPWGWHIKTQDPLGWLELPMLAVNPWRLSLLFLVSGFASRAMLGKTGETLGRFVRGRATRLLLPLVVGVILVVPPQPWIELRFKVGYEESFAHFWWNDYFRFGELGGIILPTYNHLWFLLYLFLYTALLAIVLALASPALRTAAQHVFDRLLGNPLGLLCLPIAFHLASMALLHPAEGLGPQIPHLDWYRHAIFFSTFAIGFGLAGSRKVWDAIRAIWVPALVLAGLACVLAALVSFHELLGGLDFATQVWIARALRSVQAWATIAGLVGLADRFWNRDAPPRSYLALGVFPFYIVHQTIIVCVGYWLIASGASGLVQFLGVFAATILGCWAFYELARRSGPLKPLAGLR